MNRELNYATVNDLEQAFGSDTTTEIVAYAWLSIAVINFECNEC